MVTPPVEAATPEVVVDLHSIIVDLVAEAGHFRAVALVVEAHVDAVVAESNQPSTHPNSSIKTQLMW